MSKIICEVCGTAYPEVSAQCPICGCVRPADAQGVPSNSPEAMPERSYQHVKGGRFSKSNVRKRTMSSQGGAYSNSAKTSKAAPAAPAASTPPKKKKKKSSGNMGLVITIFVLLLAIIAVVAYILIKFFIPAPASKPEVTDPIVTEEPTEPVVETIGDIPCQDLVLDAYELSLENAGDYTYLTAMPEPFDTTDELIFESSDNATVMVESDGRVTAVYKGEATITVTCGIVSAQCKVTVGVPQIVFELNRQEITFENAGDTWVVYSGEIPMDDIIWSSDDPTVASVTNGIVTAVGSGITTVYGDYNGEIISCVVRCEFAEEPTEAAVEGEDPDAEVTDPTEPADSEAPSDKYKAPFKLKNLIGPSAEEVSLYVGNSFSLALVDSNGTHIEGVTWTVEGGSSCTVSDGTVKAVRSGNCVIVATYGGETYKCKIIVW